MAARPDAVSLIALLIEGVLYGILVSLFGFYLFVMLQQQSSIHSHITSGPRSSIRTNIGTSLVVFFMFLLGTAHLGVDIFRALNAFVYQQGSQTPNEVLLVANESSYLAKIIIYYLQTLVADGFWLYCAYIVWNNDKRVGVILIVFLLGSAVTGARLMELLAHATDQDFVFSSQYNTWTVLFLVFMLASNLGSTGLIATRIWYIHRQTLIFSSGTKDRRIPTIVITVIESGAIQAVALAVMIVLYLCKSFAQYVVYDADTQLIGIIFIVIILRSTLGLSNYRKPPVPKTFMPPRETQLREIQHDLGGSVFVQTTKTWSSNSENVP
ncbi:hypothetical protein VNI00_008883 [Paramarasmius palmivorus]|uniref:Uncharacterized protein n=1 Tax=Paramarasmius palmivorus TaxID=297713 RepID=A0AAW0APS6_9AGAR